MSDATPEAFRISPEQHRIWALQRGGGVFRAQCALGIRGELDRDALRSAFWRLADRHEILRTTFQRPAGLKTPYQVIGEEACIDWAVSDLPDDPGVVGLESAIDELLSSRSVDRLNFEQGPLILADLVVVTLEEHMLLLTLPALCGDLPSLDLLVRELMQLYSAGDAVGPESDEPMQYVDFSEWHQELLQGDTAEDWFATQQTRPDSPGRLGTLATPESDRSSAFSPRCLVRTVSAQAAHRLGAIGRGETDAWDDVLAAVWAALAWRLTGNPDIVLGEVASGRRHDSLRHSIGPLARTIPFRTTVRDPLSFLEVVSEISRARRGALDRQYAFKWPDQTSSEEPVSIRLAFESQTRSEMPEPSGLTLRLLRQHAYGDRFELRLTCWASADSYVTEFHYDDARYSEEEVRAIADQYHELLASAVESPEAQVGALRILGEAERQRLLVDFNAADADPPLDRLVFEAFERQVRDSPDRVAVVCEEQSLSYAELNRRANRLAGRLGDLGAGPETIVGIFMERSVEFVTAMFGVMKAGAAFAPIDSALPSERRGHIIDDAGIRLLVTKGRSAPGALPEGVRIVRLEEETEPHRGAVQGSGLGVDSANAAYVIYTSGSTGRPKGVCVEHQQLVSYVAAAGDTLDLPPGASFATVSTFGADLGHTAIFPALCGGGTLHVVADPRLEDPDALALYLGQRRIDCLKIVPSFLDVLLTSRHPGIAFTGSRVVVGGEPSTWRLASRVTEHSPGAVIVNHYGPTEATVGAVAHPVTPGSEPGRSGTLPIGRPLANSRVYVVDAHGAPVPVGVVGDLQIGGRGVARGYLGQPAATAERFRPDPYTVEKGARLYETGDLARHHPEGGLEFRGRSDYQLKIRGYRVELGEIEAALRGLPDVREAVVTATDGAAGQPRLFAYVTADPQVAFDGDTTSELRRTLAKELPDYMIPDELIHLDVLPLNRNGKVDRDALPKPEASRSPAGGTLVAPRNPVEEQLAGIWNDLLAVEEVSIHDDFFALGGHSLLAMRLVLRIRQELEVDLPVHSLFEAPTVAGLAQIIFDAQSNPETDGHPRPVPRDAPLPLSFAQQRLWFLDELEPSSIAYNRPAALRLGGPIDQAALEQALGEIVRRHEVLRTTFESVDGEPVQRIADEGVLVLRSVDLQALSAEMRGEVAHRLADSEAGRQFDLARGPLLRAWLLRLNATDHLLLFTQHHIITDAWSNGVMIRELSSLYGRFARGKGSELEEIFIQYADFAVWQRRWLQGETLQDQMSYWKEQLLDAPAPLELPTDRPRPAVRALRGAREPWALSRECSDAIRTLSRERGVTVFMTVLAAFQTLLHRYTGLEDITVGSPIAGRVHPSVEGLLGFFVNTLVFRSRIEGDPTFAQFLGQVKEVALEAFANQDVPFEELVETLQPERSLSRTPFFDVMFVFDQDRPDHFELSGLDVELLEAGPDTAKFDLTLNVLDNQDGIRGSMEYDTELFDPGTIRRMLRHFERLVAAIADEDQRSIYQLPLMAPEELDELIVGRNSTASPYPDSTIHRVFEQVVAEHPDSVALVAAGRQMTYAELNDRANRLSYRLRSAGVGLESKVGICLERSPEMVIALLAVLKCGAAYVPLDPEYPESRLRFIVADAGISVVVASSELAAPFAGQSPSVALIRAEQPLEHGGPSLDPASAPLPESLAYVIYTSGSTGSPKGVEVPHRGVLRLLFGVAYVELDDQVAVAHFSSPTFDASTFEMWGPLLHGGRLVLAAESVSTPREIGEAIERHGLTTMWLTSSLFNSVVDESARELRGLRQLLIGGEALSPGHVRRALQALDGTEIINGYGPTESTTFTCCHPIPRHIGDNDRSIPIGSPIANTKVYVLDRAGQPTVLGASGELHIGGDGLGRGYLAAPDLTAARFVPDHVSGNPGDRLYRSGDIARYMPSGLIEFFGRADHQVKIRGFRIELGEVETVLRGHPSVRQAVVLDREHATKGRYLTAYYVARDEHIPTATGLKDFLRTTLPDHMIPGAFVELMEMPLTANGKLDRAALPEPELTALALEGAYVAPRTPTEEILAEIWSKLLGVESVGIHDDFFLLGGHSLLATRVVSRVRAVLQTELPLRALFENPTIAGVSAQLTDSPRRADAPIPRIDRGGELPLSFAQGRLWFLDQLGGARDSYNVPAAVRLTGPISIAALEQALQGIVSRHEALRTTFVASKGRPRQVVAARTNIVLSVVEALDVAEGEIAAMALEESRRGFDLAAGPLLRATILRLKDEEHIALFTMHHIVSDGWSMGLLIGELRRLYEAHRRGDPCVLPELPVQYVDYAAWQRAWLEDGALDEQLSYWEERLADAPSTLQLPTDRPRPAVQSFSGAKELVALSTELSRELRELGDGHGVTVFMTLMAGLAVVMSRYTGQREIVVGTPIAGRSRSEIEGLIGFFVNTLAMRVDLAGDPTVIELLAHVRESALGAYAHQDLPFERLLDELDVARDLSRTPLFQVMLALQNTPVEPAEFSQLSLEPIETGQHTAKFDLTLNLSDTSARIQGALEYNTDLFDAHTIRRMAGHLKAVLGEIAANPERRISELGMLTLGELEELEGWNETEGSEWIEGGIHERFEAQVKRTPDAVAVVHEGEQLSYGELNRRANQLARYLRGKGVGTDELVGLCMERGPSMVVGILGILKAGGAYLPLDPDSPKQRLAFIVEDAGASVVVTEDGKVGELPGEGVELVRVDGEWEGVAAESGEDLGVETAGEALAYVIYTSGSTGTPKGTMITHGNVTRLMSSTEGWFEFSGEDVWTLFHSYAFDFSVWELWGALIYGGRLVIVPYTTSRSPEVFHGLMCREGVTVLNQTPSAFRQLMGVEEEGIETALRYVVFGGEALDMGGLKPWTRRHGTETPRLINMYGITETTVHVTYRPIGEEDVEGGGEASGIGRQIPDLQLHVLDRDLNAVPVGVPGEIYVGGAGLARAYLHRAGLTSERFVPDPFMGEGSRLYRTGDQARRLGDGSLEYLGRIDAQVKIRGFRIELGEIEAQLTTHESVREAVVVAHDEESGQKRLVGYVVGAAGTEPTTTELRAHLEQSLPAYMVPSAFVFLDQLPLTSQGKVDRRALPEPDRLRPQLGDAYVAPQTLYETTLAEIWSEVLDLDRVGLHDNFFELGGNSLLIVESQARIFERLDRDIPVVDLFQHPTVSTLAQRLQRDARPSSRPFEQVSETRPQSAVSPREPIAIIGMAGRFPGSPNLESFWENLREGVESIRLFTRDELSEAGVDQELIDDPSYVAAKGWLEGVGLFDASFFGYSPREAELTDPQQRLFLHCAYEALENAAYDPNEYPGAIGVYAGSSTNAYTAGLQSRSDLWATGGGVQAALSSGGDHLPTRVSYKLNLRGPSVNVQTACSTSLVAIHEACKSLLDGECEIALAGGVSARVPLVAGYHYREDGIVSPDGHCRPFDAEAKGTVPGSGVGVVVLKRLSSAVDDGDQIRAVILGSAINNDGALKVGYSAPSVEGQAQVVSSAYEAAGVSPDTIGYVEAHGTGTALGDPIEVSALTQAFGEERPDRRECLIGAVKSNIGHLDAAAGVAGLIKTVLCLEREEFVPTLFFDTPNPGIDFRAGGFSVSSTNEPWESRHGMPRRAGVSSFGIGGTNAHAVLEEAPTRRASGASRDWQLLVVSAKTSEALAEATRNLRDHLQSTVDSNLADAAYTLKVGRRSFDHRRAVVCRDKDGAIRSLDVLDSEHSWTASVPNRTPGVVFMFTGQGAQYPNMGRDLYEHEPVFQEVVDRCAVSVREQLGVDLREVLFVGGTGEDPAATEEEFEETADRLRTTSLTQPSLFVIELALARLWMSWGIQPAAMIGHSIGEYVAACLSGVLSEADALRIVCERGRLMQSMESGSMLAVTLEPLAIEPFLSGSLSLAAVNAPGSCVVSGEHDEVSALERRLHAEEVGCIRLDTSHAFHSALMDKAVDPFVRFMEGIRVGTPEIPYLSNVTGAWIDEAEVADPAYWGRQMRKTVQFADGVQKLLDDETLVFLEIGPGDTLKKLVRRQGEKGAQATLVSSLRLRGEAQSDEFSMARALGRLWVAGVEPDWGGFYAAEQRNRVELPTYPFRSQLYWADPVTRPSPTTAAESGTKRPDVGDWFYLPSWRRTPASVFEPALVEGEARSWLVFADACGLGARIVRRLEGSGQRVAEVRAGESFERTGDLGFTLDPDDETHYGQLFERLAEGDLLPTDVLHLWTVTDSNTEARVGSDPQALGFRSLLQVAQEIGSREQRGPVTITAVSNHVQDVSGDELLWPEKATVLGPCRVIPREYPELRCRHVDVILPSETAAAHAGDGSSGSRGDRRQLSDAGALVDQLLAEHLNSDFEDTVAYRGVHRLVQSYEPFRLDRPEGQPPRLRSKGVYLITGGLGGIGRTIGDHLARTLQARLLLTSRTRLPDRENWDGWMAEHDNADPAFRAIQWIRQIEQEGAQVLAVDADVADEARMRDAVKSGEDLFGPIQGVIHAAGLPDGALIPLRTSAMSEEVLAPKVRGALVLDRLLGGRDLDFFVLCSSLASIQGPAGQVAYCGANAFLDAFAAYRARADGNSTVSINWDTWRDVGMAVEALAKRSEELDTGVLQNILGGVSATPSNARDQAGLRRQVVAKLLEGGISSFEGVDVFSRILARSMPQIAVSTQDLEARRAATAAWEEDFSVAGNAAEQPVHAHPRPDLSTDFVPPSNQVEQAIADLWRATLGVEPIGVHDSFFDLGGDSLAATQLLARIRAQFDTDLPIATFFNGPTIADLAEVVGSSDDESRVTELSALVKSMSAEEKAALLEQARRARES